MWICWIALEVHDQNNNYSADRKKDETAGGLFFKCRSEIAANDDDSQKPDLFPWPDFLMRLDF
jgi:hypothetical protein